jgi:hypothetical protein
VDIPQVSFAKGEISPIAAARTDQAFYQAAVALAQNFFVRLEGGMSNRPGLQFVAQCISNTPNGSYLLPFIYNNQQSYLCEFAAGSVTVYAQGALVESGITNSYALTDLPNLRWAQSADTLTITVATTPPYQLKRLTATSFSFIAPQLLNGPFQDINTDGTTYMYASATQGNVEIFCSSPIFTPEHVGALITIQEQFENAITPWTAEQFLKIAGAGAPLGLYTRSNGNIYQCVAWNSASSTAGNGVTTGTFQPVHTNGTQADGNGQNVPNFAGVVGVSWQFVSTNAGCALITEFIDAQHVKATVQSDEGVWSNFPPTVVGPPITAEGPWTFSGNGSTATFSPLTGLTVADPNQFLVTVGGVFQDPSTYQINQTGTSITFFTPPVAGTNNISVTQVTGGGSGNSLIAGLPLSTYWAFGSISEVQGYPAVSCYYNDRLVYAGTQLQPQTFFCSKVSNYLDNGVSTPQQDSDSIIATINARRENPIVDLIPMNNLLIGTASTIWRATDTSGLGAITPSNIALLPQNFYGEQPIPSVQTGDTVIYVQWGGRKIRDLVYQFMYDKFVGTELTAFARQMFPYGTSCTRLAYAPEPFGLIFCVRSDGVLCVCTYLPEQQMTGWTRWITDGFFEDVQVIPENNTFVVYVIVRRLVNGATVRYIEKFAPREYATPQDAFFVDSGLTYDGRTVTAPAGSTWLANATGTLSASGASGWAGFQSSDPGYNNALWLNDSSGNRLCRLQIIGVTSSTIASVKFLDPVPAAVQNTPVANWTFARTDFAGLTNLIGATVAVFADGATQPQQVVSATGTVSLPSAAGVAHMGLPYTCQLQSLPFDIQNQQPIRNRMKTPSRLSVVIDESTSFFAGPDFVNLQQVAIRDFEDYGQPITPHTGVVHVQLTAEASDDSCVCLQHADPVPLTVLAWYTDVSIGEAA